MDSQKPNGRYCCSAFDTGYQKNFGRRRKGRIPVSFILDRMASLCYTAFLEKQGFSTFTLLTLLSWSPFARRCIHGFYMAEMHLSYPPYGFAPVILFKPPLRAASYIPIFPLRYFRIILTFFLLLTFVVRA